MPGPATAVDPGLPMVAGASPRATGDGLAVVGATVAYPGGRALTDVSVAFGRGRVHVLAGENGAG